MKQIVSAGVKEKKVKKNQLILGVILIGLMIFSTLGYALGRDSNSEEKIEYNGIEFVRGESGYWNFDLQGFDFNVLYNPLETEEISFFNLKTLADYQGKPLYFAGETSEGVGEIGRNLNYFVSRINQACLEECENYPVKNCSEDNVIIFQEIDYESEKEEIYQEDNCVFIKTSFRNQTVYADAFLFDLLGIK